MLKMRYFLCTTLSVVLLSMIACSWSAKQQEILNAFDEISGYINENEWESTVSSMSSSTMLLLDSLAADFSARGLQGYDSGTDLLPILCTEYIDLNGDVTTIFLQGDQAEITLTSNESHRFQMILEEDHWKLDLSGIFRNELDIALAGSYVR